MPPISVWLVLGTRPEAIKMLPLVKAMQQDPRFTVTVCVTGQHREMLNQVMSVFGVLADIDLDVMQHGQDLSTLTSKILLGMNAALSNQAELGLPKPDRILVHGDTTTCFAATLAAHYHRIPVGHVEAGLRTYDLSAPFPEEGNRQLTRILADLHLAPTEQAAEHLRLERVDDANIAVTGNTVIDALMWVKSELSSTPSLRGEMDGFVKMLSKVYRNMVLVTGHRRENHGEGFREICAALRTLALQDPALAIVYPVHPNPNVKGPVEQALSDLPNIYLIPPQEYAPFVYLMMHASIILTDSGGIQEEAPSLGKPVLVMRDVTERPEAVAAGTVKLVGADAQRITTAVSSLLYSPGAYQAMAKAHNPYGDGHACQRILTAITLAHQTTGVTE